MPNIKDKFIEDQYSLFQPESDWTPDSSLPDLSNHDIIAIDLETRDDGLKNNMGPGWVYGAGHVCGVAWATLDSSGYIPINHPDTPCMDRAIVADWLSGLYKSNKRIVMHNSPYDVGWSLRYLNTGHPLHLEDTLAMAAMLDENRTSYSLDNCCRWQNVSGKNEELLEQAARAYGVDPKGGLWKLPARYVGPYAEKDAEATIALFHKFEMQLKEQKVWGAYRTECELIPMVIEMRNRGIRIDVDKAEKMRQFFLEKRDNALKKISDHLSIGRGVDVGDVYSPQFLEKIFIAESIKFQKTEKTERGSFQTEWMERVDHWLPQNVTIAKKSQEAAEKFIKGYVLDFMHKGRLHAEVHQFRSDSGGTRTQRFSYSNPPLQQMPSPDKNPEVGKAIRGCFLPEEGDLWLCNDYSQQEPRLTVHFAVECNASGSQAALDYYLNNPNPDYHTMVAEMTGQPRPRAKILNLGMTYGQGSALLAEQLGVPLGEAKRILEEYHDRMPFVKALTDKCSTLAASRGYIRLLDGARRRFDSWDAGWISTEEMVRARENNHSTMPCSFEEANQRCRTVGHPWYGKRLRRSKTHKAMNSLIQGSAARQTKLAMLACWKAGYLPLLQMHDDLNFSINSKKMVEETSQIMRDVVKLRVPMKVDSEVGPNWGEAKMNWEQASCHLTRM